MSHQSPRSLTVCTAESHLFFHNRVKLAAPFHHWLINPGIFPLVCWRVSGFIQQIFINPYVWYLAFCAMTSSCRLISIEGLKSPTEIKLITEMITHFWLDWPGFVTFENGFWQSCKKNLCISLVLNVLTSHRCVGLRFCFGGFWPPGHCEKPATNLLSSGQTKAMGFLLK